MCLYSLCLCGYHVLGAIPLVRAWTCSFVFWPDLYSIDDMTWFSPMFFFCFLGLVVLSIYGLACFRVDAILVAFLVYGLFDVFFCFGSFLHLVFRDGIWYFVFA